MAFVNTNNLPPMGYQVFIAQTGFTTTPYTGLDATVRQVVEHRKANPRFDWPTDEASVRDWVLAYTEARLRQTPGGEAYLVGSAQGPPPDFSSALPRNRERRAPLSAAVAVKKVMPGVSTILAWLGDGLKPVDQATADSRASICARCVNNVQMEGLQKAIGTAGDILHSIMEAKNHLKLATPHDPLLHQCSACWCVLATKVWAPSNHIREGITPEIESKLSPECWIRPLLK